MYSQLRRAVFSAHLKNFFVCILIGVFLLLCSFTVKPAKPIETYTMAGDEVGKYYNQYVRFYIDNNFGAYAEYTSEKRSKVKTTDYSYIVLVGNTMEDARYISVKLPAKYDDEMMNIENYTYGDIEEQPEDLEIVGYVVKMEREEIEMRNELFLEAGWTESEIKEVTEDYMIDATTAESKSMSYNITVYAGFASFLAGFVVIIFALSRFSLSDYYKDLESNGYNKELVEADYALATNYGKRIKIGKKYLFILGKKPRVACIDNLYWVYRHETVNKVNGIMFTKTQSLVLYGLNRCCIMQEGLKKKDIEQFFEYLEEVAPWIIYGYSYELASAHSKNMDAFLDLKYNTVRAEYMENRYYINDNI